MASPVMRVTRAEMAERGDEIRAKAAKFDAKIVVSDDKGCADANYIDNLDYYLKWFGR